MELAVHPISLCLASGSILNYDLSKSKRIEYWIEQARVQFDKTEEGIHYVYLSNLKVNCISTKNRLG